MESRERESVILAVKALFERIEQGLVQITDGAPETVREIEAVRFDRSGRPIYETIGPFVRLLARTTRAHDVKDGIEERASSRSVHALLGPPVPVTDAVLQEALRSKSFNPLVSQLYRETITMASACSRVHIESQPGAGPLERNQAICVGLLVRITKFMGSVAVLFSHASDRGEAVEPLNRSILESAINLRYLALRKESRFFDQFVEFSLSPERELHDLIRHNIDNRGGVAWPIERRMLTSIERVRGLSGVAIEEVDKKLRNWGGSLRNRLEFLGDGDLYAQQRVASHAVHGTWVDLLQRHLTAVDGGFEPKSSGLCVDARVMLPICIRVLQAARVYMDAFFPPRPELRPLLERIEDLDARVRSVDQAHEQTLQRP
ncbi:MAG: DUF5677 domain-containing protein [Acidobacteriota bacterium]|nr:DUF5677 domain-containing protein [Acidobacteriota bacterium]